MKQQDKILILLKEAGSKGVNSYGIGRQIALQLPRVMNDLKKAGYLWTTRSHKDRSVDYILISEPKQAPKPIVEPKIEMQEVVVKENGYEYLRMVPVNQQQNLL